MGNKWVFGYDTHSNMNSIDKTQFGVQEKESIIFDLDNKVTNFQLHQGTVKKLDQTIVYDTIGRILSIGTKDGSDVTKVTKSYEYKPGVGTNGTTTLVSKETIGSMVKEYTYDLKGNITSITVGGNTISYTYDLIGQLLTEDNEVTGEYIVYDYDTGGNIQTKTVTLNGGTPVVYNYSYDSVWKDKLVSFDGKSLTYDAIGNPLSIGDSVLTWTQGRKLSTFKKDATSETANYTYDENGIRRTKTFGNELIEYITSGGEVVAQRSNNRTPADSSDDVVITFTRGADGSLISMNRNGTIYYYVTNIQGDVEQILDSSGNVVVSYVYDAYGRVVSISGDFASTIGDENPFRYRSYYFDSESGYYYLQSRYYDPLMGRFINADGQVNIGVLGNNTFAYCENNPINLFDKEGEKPKRTLMDENYSYNNSFYFIGYILGQGHGSASKLKFGLFKGSYNGCGWIATYNATIMLGKTIQPAKIIKYYEYNNIPSVFGAFGINPLAIVGFFKSKGYKVSLTYNIKNFDKVAKKNKANIAFYFHNNGAHYFASKWNGSTFLNYNLFASQKLVERRKSISDYLKEQGWGYVLISIS